MFATGRPLYDRVSGRNAWVSYHALALELTVTRPDCQRPLRGSASLPAADRHRDPRCGSAGNRSGHHVSASMMELMGIEPTTSGLQNRRSPS